MAKGTGRGKLLLSSFGNIYEQKEVDGDYIVDTGHIVAFEDTLTFELSKAGTSWLHSIFGGEGIVCRFKGKGKFGVSHIMKKVLDSIEKSPSAKR